MWLQARDKTLIYHNWTKNSLQLNRDTQAEHLSSLSCIYQHLPCFFYALGRNKCSDTLLSFMWYLVLLKVYPQSLKGGEKAVAPTRFCYDTAGLAEEERMSQVQYQLLTRNLRFLKWITHVVAINHLKIKIFIILCCPPSGPADHSWFPFF